MPRKQKQDNTIKEFMVVEDPAAIKLLFVPRFVEIVRLLGPEELSVSDIARMLNINPGSAYYRLKVLEKHGLVKQVREEIQGGVVKKFYRKAAVNITIDTSSPGGQVAATDAGMDESYKERLLKAMAYFGYELPEDKIAVAKDRLVDCDGRIKAILKEVQQVGLERSEPDRILVSNAYQLALLMRLVEDKEMYSSLKALAGSFSRKKSK